MLEDYKNFLVQYFSKTPETKDANIDLNMSFIEKYPHLFNEVSTKPIYRDDNGKVWEGVSRIFLDTISVEELFDFLSKEYADHNVVPYIPIDKQKPLMVMGDGFEIDHSKPPMSIYITRYIYRG